MSWSKKAREKAEPIYQKIIAHPFVTGLAAGTLPRECFDFYLTQDSIYLGRYCRVLSHLASGLPGVEQRTEFLGFATHGMEVERALHGMYLAGRKPSEEEISPTCELYTSFLLSKTAAPVEVEAAAVLPCFRIYKDVGDHIAAIAEAGPTNPYRAWIDTYSDESFADSVRRAEAVADNLAARASEDVRKEMTEAYLKAARMEWLFWDSALNLEKWKI